jgi:hypothetical protein
VDNKIIMHSGAGAKRDIEVAARIINKQRAQFGETRGEKKKDAQGKSPDRDLPIDDYQHLTAAKVKQQVGNLSMGDLRKVESYKKKHKNRKGVLDAIEQRRAAG